MDFGGPVWHASVTGPNAQENARRALFGVGDSSLGEWADWGGVPAGRASRTFHLRRRLAPAEEALVGPAVDIRGFPEARERLDRVATLLPGYRAAIMIELEGVPQP